MKQSKKPVPKAKSVHQVQSRSIVPVAKLRNREAASGHNRAITRQIWLLYLNSWQFRGRLWFIVFTRKYPHRTICEKYCKTYASRKRCEHIVNSLWTRLSVSFAVALGLLVAAQLAYPADRALPLARLEGHGYVGFRTYSQIAAKIGNTGSKKVTILTGGSNTVSSLAQMGVAVDTSTTFDQLSTYKIHQRLIPFSILVAGNDKKSINRHIDEVKLTEFAKNVEIASSRPSQDALIVRHDTKLTVISAQNGYESSLQILKQQIREAKLQDDNVILSPKILLPRISTQEAQEKATQMQRRIDTPLVIKAAEHTFTADSATLASWVDIIPEPDKKTIDLSFSKTRVDNFLKPVPAAVDQQAKPEIVTLLNGLAAGSTRGSAGRVVSYDELVKEVTGSINAGTITVWAKVNAILPPQTFERRYSRDSRGIQSLIDYWASLNQGRHGVDFRTINGRMAATLNPFRQFTAAGSNKLFIAHLISGRLDAGSLQNSTPTSAGLNVASCMDKMVRLSDNSCTLALGSIVGWGNSDTLLRNQGFTYTTLVSGGGTTSASDTSNWFTQLLSGSLTSAGQRNSLISLLSNQATRTGIPAGSAGIVVANKAGSLRGNVFDAAVVYHPGGTYILSVISDGGTFPAIADLAAQINRVLSE